MAFFTMLSLALLCFGNLVYENADVIIQRYETEIRMAVFKSFVTLPLFGHGVFFVMERLSKREHGFEMYYILTFSPLFLLFATMGRDYIKHLIYG
jgi:hypothetical protein